MISRLLKQRFTLILITLLITLQISSCGNGSNPTATSADSNSDINSGPATGTDTSTNNNSTTADINLSWAAPAEREDSSSISLSEIAGYQVYYGKAQGQYSNSVTINDGTATGYTLANLPSGTYHFVMTTLDTEGRESQLSPEIVLTV